MCPRRRLAWSCVAGRKLMVFFNYSTMQMAAKVVYYGPGLCGKTTNLQHVYSHTSRESRGEMVSLETETDRTLFFDLLPLDVGSIQGFNTRIQLYTVPGQVFYNTTRKLVLKGVDGVVFVADSQRPMLQANIDSFKNLEENLGEIGLSVDDLPLVLQYNKRDLNDVCSMEELEAALNRGRWPSFEASAIDGRGVFETLKAISKLTLLSLKKRIAESQRASAKLAQQRAAASGAGAPASEAQAPAPPPADSAAPAKAQPAAPGPAEPASTPGTGRRQVDILAELEKIRRQTMGGRPKGESTPTATVNGSREIDHEVHLTLPRASFSRARHFSFSLQLEDDSHQVVDSFQEGIEVEDLAQLDQLLLRLKIALQPNE